MEEKKTKKEPEEESSSSTTMEKAGEMDETTSSTSTTKCKKAKDEESSESSSESDEVEKAGYEESPSESAEAGKKDSNTVTPGKMTGKPQNVFVPPTNIPGNRMGSGSSPGQEHYQGKSFEGDFQKSPLYVEMSKQMDNMSSAFSKKMDAVEKSVNDRMANILKMMEKIDKFNQSSFNKAYTENLTEKGIESEGVEKALKEGKARFASD